MTPADRIVLAMAVLGVIALYWIIWTPQGPATQVRVRAGHQPPIELALASNRDLNIDGPLGTTRVEVRQGRARIVSSPCPRQYCVHAGWLEHSGDVSTCLPNGVSLQVAGRDHRYDSINF